MNTVHEVRSSTPPDMNGLRADGYNVRELHMSHRSGGSYFEGISATKRVKGVLVEVYIGSDDGDLFFAPQAYVNGEHIGEAPTPDKAARIAEFRALMEARHA